jgi:hypothetical protein
VEILILDDHSRLALASVPRRTITNGWGVSVEGRGVGVFELDRGHHAKGHVEAWLVVPVDPASGGELDVCDGLVGPS